MDNLDRMQSDIERTRARLASNLHCLTEEGVVGELQTALIGGALAKKDQVIERAKESGQSLVNELIETVKTKAADNPTAALAIGAGLGWKLWKNPPVASVLVGFGLYSLFTGKTNTAAIADNVTDKLAKAGQELAKGFEASKTSVADAAEHAKDVASQTWRNARETVEEQIDNIAAERLHARNVALLGMAGIAVAAAVGLAIQKFREED